MGLISLIQRFSVQDGPGMRTTVFMKGCSLSCWWCQNPESINPAPELMVNDSKCQMCGKCADSCSVDAIYIYPEEGRKIDRTKCNRCFECVDVCPTGALKKVGEYMSVAEVMKEIEKDEIFYQKSKGGITISGGEPLFQAAFVTSILSSCKQRGFHTALDTSGHGPWHALENLFKYVDLILYDIKHMDPILHEKATGQTNELILSNLRKIPPDKRIWLRIPIIPGFNDDKENINKIEEIAREVSVEKISILPFHKLAEGKYQQLGHKFPAADVHIPSTEQIQQIMAAVEGHGIKVSVSE